jgi:uncharacterized protein (TIGR00106 family)
MIVAEVKVVPVGTKSPSISTHVKKAVEELKKNKKIKVRLGAMCTTIEAEDLESIFEAVKKAHNALFDKNVRRVLTTLTIDDRRDKKISIQSKLEAIQ